MRSASTAAPGGSIVAYDWDFGNGVTKSGVTTSNLTPRPGRFRSCSTVTDDAGQKATATQTVTVVQPGPTTTTAPPSNAVVHYVGTPPAPNVPADLTLLFQLLSAVLRSGPGCRLSGRWPNPTYGVSGSWLSANKTITGGIKGQFVGSVDAAVNGQFTGTLTATGARVHGRTRVRGHARSGTSLAGGSTWAACSRNPWALTAVTASQTSAPPPTSTSTAPSTHDHRVPTSRRRRRPLRPARPQHRARRAHVDDNSSTTSIPASRGSDSVRSR